MCGLVGYVGKNLAIDIAYKSLERLEYRGYDSSGIAYFNNDKINVIKSEGLLKNLENQIDKNFNTHVAIGHTRWATHGKPSRINAHPHLSQDGNIALVHNGIIENYENFKHDLKNMALVSETDTEVIAEWLSLQLPPSYNEKQVLESLAKACAKIKGSFAFGIIIKNIPDKIFFAKRKSPLIIGCGKDENFIASDIPAILPYINKVVYLKENEIGYISKDKIKIFDLKLNERNVYVKNVDLSSENVRLENFSTYMEKEIAQGSYAITNTINKLKQNKVFEKLPKKKINIFNKQQSNFYIIACGTALHAGMVAKYILERECRVPVSLDFASEFRYKKPVINKNTVCIFISQSGETADTLASLELAKKQGAYCVAITNVLGSRISQIANFVIPTYAGPEIAVASTKAYIAQLTALYSFIELFAKQYSIKLKYTTKNVLKLAKKLESFSTYGELKKIVPKLAAQESLYFIGRGLDYFLAMEGSLKLKEISYIHCEAFAGGELKHGSLALITQKTYVVVIITQKHLIDKTLNAVHEIKSRGAKVVLISQFENLKSYADYFIKLLKEKDVLMPFIAIKPLQEFAFLCSKEKGLNPDKPRNLAKSVTVEWLIMLKMK